MQELPNIPVLFIHLLNDWIIWVKVIGGEVANYGLEFMGYIQVSLDTKNMSFEKGLPKKKNLRSYMWACLEKRGSMSSLSDLS